jgi:hypothetical protein
MEQAQAAREQLMGDGTSNIQHPMNTRLAATGCSMLDVGCWMFQKLRDSASGSTETFRAFFHSVPPSRAMTCAGVIRAKQSAFASLAQDGVFEFAQGHGASRC